MGNKMKTKFWSEFHLPNEMSTLQAASSLWFLSRRKRMQQTEGKARRSRVLKRKMELKNLELYIENKCIIEANERLRKKAALLHLENLALRSQLQIISPIQSGLLPN
ncbi:hypothetical protein ACET3Z_006940 [Daucus carota]